MARDGEDCGNGVECEDHISKFYGHKGQEEHGDHATRSLTRRRTFADEERVLTGADRVDTAEPAYPFRLFGFRRGFAEVVFAEEEPDGSYEKKGSKNIADEGEAIKQGETAGDEEAAHDNGAGDSPEEDLWLTLAVYGEKPEEKKEDEEVIDRQGLFESVTGEILHGGNGIEAIEQIAAEGERGGDPKSGGSDSGAAGRTLQPVLATCIDQFR